MSTSELARLREQVAALRKVVAAQDRTAIEEFIRIDGERQLAVAEAEEARQAAITAAQEKGAFLANMSHEIRTPMNAVLGMANLLRSTDLDEEQREYVDNILGSGGHLLGIINSILDFSKLGAGELKLDNEEFDLRACIELALVMGASRSGPNVEVCYEIVGSIPDTLIGDVARLRQVLVNLIGNASKHTQEGSILVTATRGEGDEIRFSVHDTGCGIPEDQFGELFRSFGQIAQPGRHSGTGLGLVICKHLVNLMGGRIWAESTLGVGSTFSFTVNLAPGKSLSVPSLPGKPRVLIVEPYEVTRRTLVCQLNRIAAEPVACATTSMAEQCIQDGVFDVVLIADHVEGGIELARRIRGNTSIATVLMCRSSRRPHLVFRGLRDILKPIRTSHLCQLLASVLDSTVVDTTSQPTELRRQEALSCLRVLVAEDCIASQLFIMRVLEKLGCPAELTTSGREALEALVTKNYDLVLLDIHLPEIDGIELAKYIHTNIAPESQPQLVACSASVLDEERAACSAAGIKTFIPKPIVIPDLCRVLHECARQKLEIPNGKSLTNRSTQDSQDDDVQAHQPKPPGEAVVELFGPTAATQVIAVFLDASEELVRRCQEGDRVFEAAHQLKGSCGTFGADELSERAAAVEQAAKGGSKVPEALCRALTDAYRPVASSLRELLKRLEVED